MARLDWLGPAKQTALLAAALGREFSLDLLLALSSVPATELGEHLRTLRDAALLDSGDGTPERRFAFRHALIRDAAYEVMPTRVREQTHARIAETLEEQFPETVRTRPDLLAYHHAAAGEKKEAIKYSQLAAADALQRSANAEVLGHVEQAIPWLDGIEDVRERATAELELNSIRTMSLMATYGYGAPRVAEAISRSQALLPLVGEGPLATRTTWATLMYHHVRAERVRAREMAQSLMRRAETTQDGGLLVATLPVLGQCLFLEGNFLESRRHLDSALRLYDADQHGHHALAYGLDSKVYAHATLALVLWILGERDRAWEHARKAVDRARELRYPPSEGMALVFMCGLPHYEQDRDEMFRVTDKLNEVVNRYGLFMFKAFGGIFRSWAEGDPDNAVRFVDELRASGQEIAVSYYSSIVAELEDRSNQHARALATLDKALEHASTSGEQYYLPDILRLKGSYLAKQDPERRDEATQYLQQAIALARRRNQMAVETKARVSLDTLAHGTPSL